MSSADLHPEDLLDRVRRGQATAAERERVNTHLAGCEACRFEQAVLAESMRDASPQSGDAVRARAIERAALAALAERGVLAGSASRKRRRLAGAWIAAAVVSSIATAAAAAVIAKPAWLAELIPQLNAQEAPKPLQLEPARRVTPAEPAPVIAPPPPAPEVESAQEPQPERARPRKQPASASELFANANEARREQKTVEAVRLYRELQRAHPASPEASVARVALGRLLLDRSGDARGALQQFDRYLADGAPLSLAEEAMVGRALALGRLGRARAERAAWQALLTAFPGSANAERARTRIEALR
jgi:TolA-binding protein